MKTLIGILVIAFSLGATAYSQANFEKDAALLSKDRDKALAAAAEPINRRYQASLEQLLRRATQANDLDSALKIKKRLEGLAIPTAQIRPLPTSEVELRGFLVGTKWTLDGQPQNTYEFLENGVYKSSKSSARYVVTGPRRVSVIWNPQLKIECEFDENFTTFKEQEGNHNVLKRVQ